MRAVGITEPGGPEVLAVIDREVRAPGADEVRIRVRAAAVNPTDIGLRMMGAGQLQAPWTPGMDAAGVIESVGSGRIPLACRTGGHGRGGAAAARGWSPG